MAKDRLATATIDLTAYAHNISQIQRLLPDTTLFMAVLKANAYGHGLSQMARAAVESGADYLGVVSLGELRQIREAGINAPVLIMNYLDPASVEDALRLDAKITVFDEEVIRAVEDAAKKLAVVAKVHLKVDTGMHRAGCDMQEAVQLARTINELPDVELEGVYTHFAESEAVDRSFTELQLKRLKDVVAELRANGITPRIVHAANGAATIAHPKSHLSMVRVGLASNGVSPFPENHEADSWCKEHLRPVLSLYAPVVHIRTIEPGESVGYNRRWTADRRSKIALLPIGYGDGIRRTPHDQVSILVNGYVAPVVGSISMDQISIDVTNVPNVRTGDTAVFIGQSGSEAIDASMLAVKYQTIPYEVLTSISARIQREYTH